jgi:hypothetical protein
MISRFVITCMLCVWVFSIVAPPALFWAGDDPSLTVSLNDSEEEPGEGEKTDGREEFPSPSVPCLFQPGMPEKPARQGTTLPAGFPEVVWEVVSPPPEAGSRC